jgi:predicted acylesterase/phospholipase RssA
VTDTNVAPSTPAPPQRWRVGVSISGGGHRASAWGIGALLGLLRARDLDRATDDASDILVSSIASVSGGSITNGAIATNFVDLNASDGDEFPTRLARLARVVADRGLFFFGSPTNRYLVSALATVAITIIGTLLTLGGLLGYQTTWEWWPPVLWCAIVAGGLTLLFRVLAELRNLMAGIALALKRDVTFVVAAALVGAVVGAGAALTREDGPGCATDVLIGVAVASSLLWLVSIRLFARRGRVVERALAKELFERDDAPIRLAELADRAVHHVFCATELQSGDHFYLSPRLVYGYQYGYTTKPGTWTVARAVQASAALPLGFPPQRSTLAEYDIALKPATWLTPASAGKRDTRRVVLVDGGVYDNMGSEWDVGYDSRHDNVPALTSLQQTPNLLVVANAGKALAWKTIWTPWRLWWEVAGPLRDQSVQYDQTTAPRRSALIRWFKAGEQGVPGARRGVIVQASSSPYDVAEKVSKEHESPAKAARAAEWLPVLLARRTEREWRQLATRNANVKTVLRALGRPTTLDLVEHAAVLTQLQLHVHYGVGGPSLPDRTSLATALGIAD